jgi:hypothetical protein
MKFLSYCYPILKYRFIWGRGAIDMKSSVIAMFEALQQLHEKDFRPKRSILLGIGHDEEVGGTYGAASIAKELEARKTRLALLWDEGTPVLVDGLPMLFGKPVALVGTAEKVRNALLVHTSIFRRPFDLKSRRARLRKRPLHSLDVDRHAESCDDCIPVDTAMFCLREERIWNVEYCKRFAGMK